MGVSKGMKLFPISARITMIACTMGGEYSEDIKTIIEAHANTFKLVSTVAYKISYVSCFFSDTNML